MRQSRTQPCCAAALLGVACLLPTASSAQSLSMSYKLESSKAPAETRAAPVVSRCAGLSGVAVLVSGCAWELRQAHADASVGVASSATPGGYRREGVPRQSESVEAVAVARESAPAHELPALGGSTADGRLLHVAGGKEALAAAARSVDLMFRFGTKYRMRSGDNGWEMYKFTDITQENRLHSNGLKALGVELLVPFQ